MIYIDTNEKLATLLEKLLEDKAENIDKIDAKDLISELRSPAGNILLTDKHDQIC